MDGRYRGGRLSCCHSGADPAWPVGGADTSEPQDAASESLRKVGQLAGEIVALVAQGAERRLQVGELALQGRLPERQPNVIVGDLLVQGRHRRLTARDDQR